jgi:RHS repeat-associated protein
MASSSNSLSSEGMEEQNTATNGPAPMNVYLYAGDQIIENVTMGYFYYQDSLGNTSHVTDAVGNLLERYTYDAFGKPSFFNSTSQPLNSSTYGIRHLFHGQLWTQETGLNDHRNRQALPAMGVFLQPDPIGFAGGDSNLYRYCGNNPVNGTDPTGEDTWFGNRLLGYTDAAPIMNFGLGPFTTHTFVYTTNSNGTIANTYSWGADSLLDGHWIQNYSKDITAANAVNSNDWGTWQGPESLDKYVQQAFDSVSGDPGHFNFLAFYNCKQEAIALVSIARVLQAQAQGLASNGSGVTMGMVGVTGFDYIGYSMPTAVAGAIDALNAYGASHGPGFGVVTATDSEGHTRVIAGGFVGGSFSFGGTTYVGGVATQGLGTNLISTGGGGIGGWQTAGYFPSGGLPGEGFHPPAVP